MIGSMTVHVWTIVNYLLVFGVIQAGTVCTSWVQITGTIQRYDIVGIYRNTSAHCNGKDAFRQLNGPSYLYYYHQSSNSAYWVLGSDLCSEKYDIYVESDAQTPGDIQGTWHEIIDSESVAIPKDSVEIKISCHNKFEGYHDLTVRNGDSYSGQYSLQSGVYCYGYYTYKHASNNYFLYHYHGNWVVGGNTCSNHGYLKAADSALYPEDVMSDWYMFKRNDDTMSGAPVIEGTSTEEQNGGWYRSDVTTSGMKNRRIYFWGLGYYGYIAVIASTVIFGLAILIGLIIGCCKKRRQPTPNPTEEYSMAAVVITRSNPGSNTDTSGTTGPYPGYSNPYPSNDGWQPYPSNDAHQPYPMSAPAYQEYTGNDAPPTYPGYNKEPPYPRIPTPHPGNHGDQMPLPGNQMPQPGNQTPYSSNYGNPETFPGGGVGYPHADSAPPYPVG